MNSTSTWLKDLEALLASSLFEGVGPKYAPAIVAWLGGSALQVITATPAALRQISGIGPKRAESLRNGCTRLLRLTMPICENLHSKAGGEDVNAVSTDETDA